MAFRLFASRLSCMSALPWGDSSLLRTESEPFKHNLAPRRTAFELRMHGAQCRSIDLAGDFGRGGTDASRIDQRGHFVQQLALFRHIRCAKERTREHHFPME